jgi:serine phosphatase RsbU (regulator of sigma subunit)/Tfp pilus assembly protein PilF
VIIKVYNQIGEQLYSFQPDSAIKNWEKLISICEKHLQQDLSEKEEKAYLTEQSAALNNIGYVYENTGDAASAIKYLKKSLLISMGLNDYQNVAIALNNIGHNLVNTGNNVGALDYFNQSLEVNIRHGSKEDVLTSLVIMGDMYGKMHDEVNAIAYMKKALKIALEINDKVNEAYIYSLIGNEYFNFGKVREALKYDSISLRISKEIGDSVGISRLYNNIGARHYALGNYEQALLNFNESLRIREKQNDLKGLHSTLANIGTTLILLKREKEGYEKLNASLLLAQKSGDKILEWSSLYQIGNSAYLYSKDFSKAELYNLKGLELARQMGFPEQIRSSAKSLLEIFKFTGDYKKALEMQSLYMVMRDSLNNIQTRKAALNSQLKYEYEIKAAADSVRLAADKQLSTAMLEQEKTKSYALYGGIILTALFGGFMFNRYKKTNKQRLIIEQQEKETKYQKSLVDNKNREILDSINYAKRLQDAILPSDKMWKASLPDSFILYKPKDIVAGDFYWMEVNSDVIFFAAADCTGHGVPGAMVSVVCSNALNRTVKEFNITEPGKILDKVRELVIETFEKSGSDVKDGMDISLCALNIKSGELKWSGANNPLWLVRQGVKKIEELKADKQPIGKYTNESPFTTHHTLLKPGDSIYIFTDGYPDQFGGPKGKKFKSSKMKEWLLDHSEKNMQDQLHLMGKTFEDWKANHDQVDDVCVIGVRI